ERSGHSVPDEARAETHDHVERAGFQWICRRIRTNTLDKRVQPRVSDAPPRGIVELLRPLDAGDPAAERAGQDQRGPRPTRPEIQHLRCRPKPQPVAQLEDLLPAGRVLEVVAALDDRVVPRHGTNPTRSEPRTVRRGSG